MKKFVLFSLIIALVFSAFPAFASTNAPVEFDGSEINTKTIFANNTVYVSVEAIAAALGKPAAWDEKTRSLFINGINISAKKADNVSIYVDGNMFTPTDDKGTAITPIVENGEVYLPAHCICDAFSLSVKWIKETYTIKFSASSATTSATVIDTNKSYVIINKATGKALSAKEDGLTTEDFVKADYQKFNFVLSEAEGYYHIKSAASGKNLDVNNHGVIPGTLIITWEQGTGDNQKFKITDVPGGTTIAARSCHLPIEPLGDTIIQNSVSGNLIQKWEIAEFDSYKPSAKEKTAPLVFTEAPVIPEDFIKPEVKEAPYRIFTIGSDSLADSDGLKVTPTDSSDSQKWALVPVSDGVYVITNAATNRSLDVNARSFEDGASIIAYSTNSDSNQQWILEKNSDGTYLIRSVHSSLYLTLNDTGALIQAAKSSQLKQFWTINEAY